MRHLLFGTPVAHPRATDLGLLLLRLVGGLSLALAHGMGKVPPSAGFLANVERLGFPLPALFAWAAGLAEFGGGLLLAIGLLTRPAALLVAGNFVLVTLVANAGQPFVEREKAILFLMVGLVLLLTGPGRYAADAALARPRG